jgi:hypothetical protein
LRKIAKKRAKKRAKKLQRSHMEQSGTEVEQQQQPDAAFITNSAALASQQEQELGEIRAVKQQHPAEEPHSRIAPTVKKFGAWFPSATTVKGSGCVAGSVCICLFYQCAHERCRSCGPRVR